MNLELEKTKRKLDSLPTSAENETFKKAMQLQVSMIDNITNNNFDFRFVVCIVDN